VNGGKFEEMMGREVRTPPLDRKNVGPFERARVSFNRLPGSAKPGV